jgi:DNA-directed RNA polymerase specialized sigma24 family protein
MSGRETNSTEAANAGGAFRTTHWSVVLSAGQPPSPQAEQALATLCRNYWYPMYAFVRRQGYSAHDAQDLVQEFFSRLLQSHFFAAADRKRGRFRSFLLSSLKHFLMHEWEKSRALKRGGGAPLFSLDASAGERRYGMEPADPVTAETLYERRWALTLLETVLQRLREEFAAAGKVAWFEVLKPALTGERGLAPYAEIARDAHMTESAVKVAVHRLRQRYAGLLREEVAHTVDNPGDVEEELRHLISTFST